MFLFLFVILYLEISICRIDGGMLKLKFIRVWCNFCVLIDLFLFLLNLLNFLFYCWIFFYSFVKLIGLIWVELFLRLLKRCSIRWRVCGENVIWLVDKIFFSLWVLMVLFLLRFVIWNNFVILGLVLGGKFFLLFGVG